MLNNKKRLQLFSIIFLSLFSLLYSYTVFAGGFTIPLVGSRMSGQAAFGAYPDDTSAIYHNPAGLSLIKGLRLDLSGTLIITGTEYSRADFPKLNNDANPPEFDTSSEPSGICSSKEDQPDFYDSDGYVTSPCYQKKILPLRKWGTIPFAGLAYNPDIAGLSFGLGIYSPNNATAAFPEDGAQKYSVIDGSIVTIYTTPTIAYKPHPAVSLGLGISYVMAKAQYKRAFWIPDSFSTINPDEIMVNLDSNSTTTAWDAGIILFPGELIDILKGFQVAFTYTSKVPLEFEGKLDVTGAGDALGGMLEEGYEEGKIISRKASAEFTIPDIYKFSLGLNIGNNSWIGTDIYWAHYSLYKDLTIKLKEPLGDLTEIKDEKNSFDCWSIAFGGKYSPVNNIDLRLGVFYDQSPYPDNTYTILSPDADKAAISSGFSYRTDQNIEFNVSYMILVYKDRIIRDSKIRPSLDINGTVFTAPFSGNGDVKDKISHVLGAQLAYTY